MKQRLLAAATAAVILAALALAFATPPAGLDPRAMRAAGLVLFTVGLWALGTVPEHLTSLLFFLLAMVLAIAPPAIVFSGFSSATFWLVLGGLVIVEAVQTTGLGARIAERIFARWSHSYAALACAVMAVAMLLAFLMPGTVGRILVLVPIVLAAALRAGLAPGGRGTIGLLLVAIVGSYQAGLGILSANAPNLVLAGVAEQLYGVHFTYAQWLWLQFPVMAFAKCAVLVWLACWLFGEPVARVAAAPAAREPMSAAERRLMAILLVAIALWATDFLHHIAAGWIALAAAIAVLLPRLGVLPAAAFNDIRFSAAIYIGATLGLGAVSVATGLADVLGAGLRGWLPLAPDADFGNFMVLTTLGTAMGMVGTNPAQPALMGPLAATLAEAAGWPIEPVLMTMAVGIATMVLPYQVPPVVVGLQTAGIATSVTLRLSLPIALLSLVVFNPLNYLWWRLTGFL